MGDIECSCGHGIEEHNYVCNHFGCGCPFQRSTVEARYWAHYYYTQYQRVVRKLDDFKRISQNLDMAVTINGRLEADRDALQAKLEKAKALLREAYSPYRQYLEDALKELE